MVAGLVILGATAVAHAAPRTWVGDVSYDFVDQNGVGWVTVRGTITVTIVIDGKHDMLHVRGKRSSVDGQLVAGKTPNGAPDMKTREWSGDVDESYPLHDVVTTGKTITFKLDPIHEHLDGTCAPTKLPKIKQATLYECTISGFAWHPVATLPELHHPFVVDVPSTQTRVANAVHGNSKPGFGQRTVTLAKLPRKP